MSVAQNGNSKEKLVRLFGKELDFNSQVGEPVIIEHKGKRFESVLRGANRPYFVLVDIPVVNGRQALFEYNTKLTIRFLTSGAVCAFTAYITRTHGTPPLLVLEYPELVDKYRLRKSDRIPVKIPATAEMEGLPGKLPCAILDISDDGVLVGLNPREGVSTGKAMKLSFILPDGRAVDSVGGSLRRIESVNEKILAGVVFNVSGNGAAASVTEFYRKCLEYREK